MFCSGISRAIAGRVLTDFAALLFCLYRSVHWLDSRCSDANFIGNFVYYFLH